MAQGVTGPPTNLTKWQPGLPYPSGASICAEISPNINLNATRISYATTNGQYDASWVYDDAWVMNLDGTGKTRLRMSEYYGGMDHWGQLSPDGSKVVLERATDWDPAPSQLYIVTVDPFTRTQITLDANSFPKTPTWKSDGTMVAFVCKERSSTGTSQLFMMKPVPEDASNVPVQLTAWMDGEALYPRGTPDGRCLVLKKISDSVREIFIVDFKDSNGDGEGDNLTQLTSFGKKITSVSQSVAGGKIYFTMPANDGKNHVFSINPDGSGLHQVTGGDFSEDFVSTGQDKMVVSISDVRNGVGNPDIHIYTVNTAGGTGTVTGQLTGSAGAPIAGASVAAYDGDIGAGDTVTDANGNYTLTLPTGGYTLVFATNKTDHWEVKRSVAVYAGGTTIQDAFTTPKASNRPRGTIATIKDGKVEVKFTAVAGSEGYNIYRAVSEDGPWTKITPTPIAPTIPARFVDTTPPDLASVFYKVTSVIGGVESCFSEVSQAANNLFFNPSFEQVDGSGKPLGWSFGTWGGDGTGGTSTTEKVDGNRAAYVKNGPTTRGAMFWVTELPFYPVVMPGVSMVEGMWGKFIDTQSTWPIALKQAPWEAGYGSTIYWWYPNSWERGPNLGPWDTNGLTNGGGDSAWTWLYNVDDIKEWEFTEGTRFSCIWENDGLSTLDSSTALFDDVTYQVKRFGATGWVMGRIVDQNGKTPAGVKLTCGGKTVYTDGSDTFVIKDVPTGVQTLTIEAPGNPTITRTVPNYGGYRLQEIITVQVSDTLIVQGTVYDEDGKPVPGADVRIMTKTANGDSGAQENEYLGVTDAKGEYSITVDAPSAYESEIVAHKNGYVSEYITENLGSTGTSVGNDIKLTTPARILETAKGAAPTLDGKVTSAEWGSASTFSFVREDLNIRTTVSTKWDDDNLYFGIVCEEPNPAGIYTPTTSNDGAMWGTDPYWNGDDLIEFRIDQKNGAGVGLSYEWWQLLCNAINVITDIEWRWEGPFLWGIGSNVTGMQTACAVSVANKAWYMEAQIPFSGLYTSGGGGGVTPAVGDEWYVTVGRARHQPEPVGSPSGSGDIILRFVNTLSSLPKGDLDGNRMITTADAIIAVRIAAGLEALGNRLAEGDVSSDAKVNIVDATMILRKVNGLATF